MLGRQVMTRSLQHTALCIGAIVLVALTLGLGILFYNFLLTTVSIDADLVPRTDPDIPKTTVSPFHTSSVKSSMHRKRLRRSKPTSILPSILTKKAG